MNDTSNQLDPQAQENILITDLVPSDTVKLSYDDGVLPDTLYTGEKLLQNALKVGATYHVATVAFTERQVGSSVQSHCALSRELHSILLCDITSILQSIAKPQLG